MGLVMCGRGFILGGRVFMGLVMCGRGVYFRGAGVYGSCYVWEGGFILGGRVFMGLVMCGRGVYFRGAGVYGLLCVNHFSHQNDRLGDCFSWHRRLQANPRGLTILGDVKKPLGPVLFFCFLCPFVVPPSVPTHKCIATNHFSHQNDRLGDCFSWHRRLQANPRGLTILGDVKKPLGPVLFFCFLCPFVVPPSVPTHKCIATNHFSHQNDRLGDCFSWHRRLQANPRGLTILGDVKKPLGPVLFFCFLCPFVVPPSVPTHKCIATNHFSHQNDRLGDCFSWHRRLQANPRS